MKFIKAGLLLVLLLASSLVVVSAQVCEPAQWAMVVLALGLLLVCIQVARIKRVEEPPLPDRSREAPKIDRTSVFLERRKKPDGWGRRRH